MFLMGEHETKLLEIAKAEKFVEELPARDAASRSTRKLPR